MLGVPTGFVLAAPALVCFLADFSLPLLELLQQVMTKSGHSALLAISFFVLAGLPMEYNGMCLIELRIFDPVQGGCLHRSSTVVSKFTARARMRARPLWDCTTAWRRQYRHAST